MNGHESTQMLADAQARLDVLERRIQVEEALERVRVCAMTMRQSDELAEVAVVVFQELEKLGIAPRRCGFAIKQAEGPVWQFWHTTKEGRAIEKVGRLAEHQIPFFQDAFAAWKQREPASLTCTFSGADLDQVIHFLLERTEVNLPDAEAEVQQGIYPQQVCFNFFFFTHGSLLAHTLNPLKEEDRAVLERFARVFDLTYRRYLDLKEAEARAREAVRDASLDRVRAEIASMRTADDLQRITPLVWRELTTLGVPFFRCGVFIMDEEDEHIQTFLTTPQGAPLATLRLPYRSSETTRDVVEHWRQKKAYLDLWDQDRFRVWMASMAEQGLLDDTTEYQDLAEPPEQRALQFVPFAQGMLYIGSAEPLSDTQIDLAQALADAFAVAYARYEDFKRLEAAKTHVEATLKHLKATQAQLVQAEKMASLGQLTAGIAHEIKNPLNFVNNFAQLASELTDEITEELDAYPDKTVAEIRGDLDALLADLKLNAEKINEHGRRADSIVRAMMQHARGGEGERRMVYVNALVEEYVNLAYHGMRAGTPDFNVTIERSYDEAVAEIDLVPQEIGRVLINLLNNAFYALYERGTSADVSYAPTVSVFTRQVEGQVEIGIQDNGPGIPETVRAKIFEPFFTTKPTGSGTGLGLSLSYDIVTHGHGGTLRVESTEGEGATFTITFPVRNA